jgi:hypothetical protein
MLAESFTKSVMCDTRIFKHLDEETKKIYARVYDPKEPITLAQADSLSHNLHHLFRSGSLKDQVDQIEEDLQV